MSTSQADEPGEDDILLGRGAQANTHSGNVRFRAMVAEHQPHYVEAKKEEKEGIARTIIGLIQKKGGKFLAKSDGGDWYEVEEKRAMLKTSQALREGMNVRSKTSPVVKTKKTVASTTPTTEDSKPAAVPIVPRPPPKVHTARDLSTTSRNNGSLSDDDVLCGRGGGTNAYIGNIRFRGVVADHQPKYLVCKRAEKETIAWEIVRTIQERGGRFLSKNNMGEWVPVEDKKAVLKCSQALREGMNVRGGSKSSLDSSPGGASGKSESKFAASLSKQKSPKAKKKNTKSNANEIIAKLPEMSRPQLEAVARALLCNGSKDAVAAATVAMNAPPENNNNDGGGTAGASV